MTLAATFLGGAKGRLLPASIPFRFFAMAAALHVLMWLVLFVGAAHATSFRGGLGPALAALHILTLGVLATTAVGASAQLLPVATRRSLVAVWLIKIVFWLLACGVPLLIFGMYTAAMAATTVGAVLATLGLLAFGLILADNLWRSGSLPVVAAYGWGALACLALLTGFGILLAVDYQLGLLSDHSGLALAHMILGGFGFMGLLALGFSHVLVPMFALAAAPAKTPSMATLVLAGIAMVAALVGALIGSTITLTIATMVGLAAAGLHLWLMSVVLKTGMRKRLGLSFVLIRGAWVMLPATLLVGLAALFGHAGPNGPTLFGLFLFVGWLLTFLLGILQRILPFLASMHISKGATPPLMSELAASKTLKLHAGCHALAFVLLALSIGTDTIALTRIGSAVGLLGAVGFAWFTLDVTRRVFVKS
jgi:hypothetical protein